MKLLVLSDSHGEAGRLSAALDAHPDALDVVFLGDGARDVETIEGVYPERRFYCVRGNCDFAGFLPAEGLVPFGGMNFYYTHGHLHGVKTGLELLADQARQMARKADGVIVGSAIVRLCGQHGPGCVKPVADYVRQMKEAIR